MSSWSKELPTTPGLYAWCDGKGGAVELHDTWRSGMTLYSAPVGTLPGDAASNRGGLWQPLTVELPAPYVPPQPPKVEVYSAKAIGGGLDLWLYLIGDECHAICVSTGRSWGTCRAKERHTHFKDIIKVEP